MILKDNSVLPFVVYVKSYKEIQPISREKIQAKGVILLYNNSLNPIKDQLLPIYIGMSTVIMNIKKYNIHKDRK